MYNRGFCSDACWEKRHLIKKIGDVIGKHTENLSYQSTFPSNAKESRTISKKGVELMEDLAFEALNEFRKREGKSKWLLERVRYARDNFRKIEERLEYLRMTTKIEWYSSKYYYWASKL